MTYFNNKRKKTSTSYSIFLFLIGLYIGYTITNFMKGWMLKPSICTSILGKNITNNVTINFIQNLKVPIENQKLLLIGVLTTRNDERLNAIHDTWANNADIIYFTDRAEPQNTNLNSKLYFVELDNLNIDSFQSSFKVLNYMHDNYINSYQYFMQIKSDSYIIWKRLEETLGLVKNSWTESVQTIFCLQGGTNIILSRIFLFLVHQHFQICMQSSKFNLRDGMDVGKCKQKFTDVSCISPSEVKDVIYKTNRTDFTNLPIEANKIFARALLIYPIPDEKSMRLMHNYYQRLIVNKKETVILRVQREINTILAQQDLKNSSLLEESPFLDDPALGYFVNHLGYDVDIRTKLTFGEAANEVNWRSKTDESLWNLDQTNWNFISKGEREVEQERDHNTRAIKDVLHYVQNFVVNNLNRRNHTKKPYSAKSLLYSYFRMCPYHGIQLILDVVLSGEDRTKLYRKHTYTQIPFGPLHIKETILNRTEAQDVVMLFNEPQYSNGTKSISSAPRVDVIDQDKVINMILALSGRFKTFQRFIDDVEREILIPVDNVVLIIALYGPDVANREKVKQVVEEMKSKYSESNIVVLEGNTIDSKASALKLGTSICNSDDIIFFVDVDITFSSEVLDRIRWVTIQGKQAYFPIVFSEYISTMSRNGSIGGEYDHFRYDQDFGLWRRFGYGMVSIYLSDLISVGGFDTSIVGWGVEDVDFFDKVMKSKSVSILRCPDPSLIHVYHEKTCDKDLDDKRMRMCKNSLYAVFASDKTNYDYIMRNKRVIEASLESRKKRKVGRKKNPRKLRRSSRKIKNKSKKMYGLIFPHLFNKNDIKVK